jgi:hypothetical protein
VLERWLIARRLAIASSSFLAALCAAIPALPLASEQSGPAISAPSLGLRLTVSVDHSRLDLAHAVQLKVELKNEAAAQALIPGAGRCSPALQLTVWRPGGRVAWAQPLPLCLEYNPGTPSVPLAPGGSISATQCLALAADGGRHRGQCALLDLPSGTYQVGGSFHGMSLPRLDLTLAP